MKSTFVVGSLFVLFTSAAHAQSNSPFDSAAVSRDKAPRLQSKRVSGPWSAPITSPGTVLFGGGDDCNAPQLASGQGTFAWDTSSATTGTEGQQESLCTFFGQTGIQNDVWFEWTADVDGLAVIETCGTPFDSKVAAYPAGDCPAPGSALACNDDACGLQSQITFPVVSGQAYLLQLGNFPGAGNGTGVWEARIFDPVNNDDCSAPAFLAGQGTFPFNTVGATTGSEGQTSCGAGANGIDNDIWYEWVPSASGIASISTCGSLSDTKIALYDGANCPGTGPAIGCNDDSCGDASVLVTDVVAGQSYLLQVGSSPGAQGGVGDLEIVVQPAVANDECTNPEPIFGQGLFPFSNVGATTGAEGQGELACQAFGFTAVSQDVWFEWTADATGLAVVSTCGQTNTDTKIAVYPGGGCPSNGDALTCNDDACGLQSTVGWDVVGGTTYLLQVGNFLGAPSGTGDLDISILTPTEGYAYDLGSTTNSIGLTAGGGIGWLHGFQAEQGSDVLTEVSTAFGTAAFGGLTAGQAGWVGVWNDPNNDFDPTDAVLLHSQAIQTVNEDTDILNVYPVPNVAVQGVFFIGVVVENALGDFPAPLDETSSSNGRAWVVGNTSGSGGFGAFDLAQLSANDVPPVDLDEIFLPGVYLLRALGDGGGLGSNYCSAAGNSVSASGSRISASGSNSLSAQDLTLRADNAPNQFGLFYFGPSQLQLPFGNGFRCVGGQVIRMPIVGEVGGDFSYQVDFASFGGGLANLGTANFQCWYRDPAAGGANFNLSDGLELVFVP